DPAAHLLAGTLADRAVRVLWKGAGGANAAGVLGHAVLAHGAVLARLGGEVAIDAGGVAVVQVGHLTFGLLRLGSGLLGLVLGHRDHFVSLLGAGFCLTRMTHTTPLVNTSCQMNARFC